LQHEKSQLDEYKLIIDRRKATLDSSLIGRWISISWHRTIESVDFFAFDVGVVTNVKNGKVFIDYKDDSVHSVSLILRGWNCYTTDTPKSEHTWRMLAKKETN
jgi:hypothetical protein